MSPRLLIFEVKGLKLMFGNQPAVVRYLVQGALDHMNIEEQSAIELAQVH
jgi:hypothetical protein